MVVNACNLSTQEGITAKFKVSLGYMVSVRLACTVE